MVDSFFFFCIASSVWCLGLSQGREEVGDRCFLRLLLLPQPQLLLPLPRLLLLHPQLPLLLPRLRLLLLLLPLLLLLLLLLLRLSFGLIHFFLLFFQILSLRGTCFFYFLLPSNNDESYMCSIIFDLTTGLGLHHDGLISIPPACFS